jgi:hypothetical protein
LALLPGQRLLPVATGWQQLAAIFFIFYLKKKLYKKNKKNYELTKEPPLLPGSRFYSRVKFRKKKHKNPRSQSKSSSGFIKERKKD